MDSIFYGITLVFGALYASMQTISVYAGDSGELVAASYTWGIAHPPGYPLYTFLGALLTHAPFLGGSVAWKMGFLSSLPMAMSLGILYLTVKTLTNSRAAGFFAAFLSGLLYPVWLYAIVPEVFGLYALFSSLLTYFLVRFFQTGQKRWLWYLSFIGGLSLTHHHLIVLFFGAAVVTTIVFFPKGRALIRTCWKRMIGLGFLGLLVYSYAPLAALHAPSFDWEHPVTLEGFFRLVTRASYGTFRASYSSGQNLMDQALNGLTFFQYALGDLTIVGLLVGLIGGIVLFWKNRTIWWFFFLYFFLYVCFFFYAGFPVCTDFSLGTLERFFIVPYQLLSLFFGIGFFGILSFLKHYWRIHKKNVHIPVWSVVGIVWVVCLLLLFRLGYGNYQKLNNLRLDRTLERFADDILMGVPQGAILNLTDDVSTFAMDYAYYVQGKRPDIIYLNFSMLGRPHYRDMLRKRHPDLILPQATAEKTAGEYIASFIRENAKVRPVIDEKTNVFLPEFWVPRGLVVMYYPDLDSIPDRGQIHEYNRYLWSRFQDLKQGTLGVYRHLMLSDLFRYYAIKHLVFAQSLLLSNTLPEAQIEMEQAMALVPDQVELSIPYVTVLLQQKHCREAYAQMERIRQYSVRTQEVASLSASMKEICPEEK